MDLDGLVIKKSGYYFGMHNAYGEKHGFGYNRTDRVHSIETYKDSFRHGLSIVRYSDQETFVCIIRDNYETLAEVHFDSQFKELKREDTSNLFQRLGVKVDNLEIKRE